MKQEGKSRMHFIIEAPYVFLKHDYSKTSKNSKLKLPLALITHNSREKLRNYGKMVEVV